MIRINIHEAKTHLSRYLDRLRRGETIVVCKRNVPVAEIRPIPAAPTGLRPIGLERGKISIPSSFFEPLPQDLLAGFDDTCTFLRIAGGAGKLSDRARDLFREGLVLLTPDELITQYPVRSLW